MGKRFSHCGVDAFQLVKTAAGWKIFQLSDTRRKEKCEIPEEISKRFKMKRLSILLLLILLGAGLVSGPIRYYHVHSRAPCGKDERWYRDPELSEAGKKRAQLLATLLKRTKSMQSILRLSSGPEIQLSRWPCQRVWVLLLMTRRTLQFDRIF